MPSLKDIRVRIGSVKTTRQVTSAMKMVSAAKFKKAHDHIIAFRPYVKKLQSILSNLASSMTGDYTTPFSIEKADGKVLMVVIASNRGLCGAFNSNVVKLTERVINDEFNASKLAGEVDILAIGKQGGKLLRSHGYDVIGEKNEIFSLASYSATALITEELIARFLDGTYKKVVLVYNKFINAASQEPTYSQFLPIELPKTENVGFAKDYIFEPNVNDILENVIPKALKNAFFSCLLESIAAEHGARMTSMHKATDNASALIKELQLAYNKARQTAITNEILEIVGGAEALNK